MVYNCKSQSGMPKVTPARFLCKRYDSRSFRYIAKGTGDGFSPCLTPQSRTKKGESWPFTEILDCMPLYMLFITWKKIR